MKTDKLRKFLIPNIPYVFIGWAFLKLSTAYRLAAGAGFLTKVMGIGQTIGPAFADFALPNTGYFARNRRTVSAVGAPFAPILVEL